MELETLLPLGKLDPGLKAPDRPLDIGSVGSDAAQVEAIGFDRLVVEETKDDPFQVMALAAASTERLGLGTSVAIAFARSPTLTAMAAWSLQRLSAGRFTLGLGTQVKGHITRRYGFEWHPAGPWARDYIRAVRAVWRCWQDRTPLAFESDHYELSLMVPLFDPGPIDEPSIPIHLAAVGPYMVSVAGEVADGVRLHPVCTSHYVDEVVRPALARGAGRSGRDPADIAIGVKPLVATAPDAGSLEVRMRTVRERVAFYLSTPAYRPVFDLEGWGDLARSMTALSKAKRWAEMPDKVTDEIFHAIAVVGTYDEIAERIVERFGGVATNVEFSIPVDGEADAERLSAILDDIRSRDRQRGRVSP